MALHAADPAYLSFEKTTLPEAVSRGIGVQAMKAFGNAALSLPSHCATVGCSTTGQRDAALRITQNFQP